MAKSSRLQEAEQLLRNLLSMLKNSDDWHGSNISVNNVTAVELIESYFSKQEPKRTLVKVCPANNNCVILKIEENGSLSLPSFYTTSRKGSQQLRDEVANNFAFLAADPESVFSLRCSKAEKTLAYSIVVSNEVAEHGLPDGYTWVGKSKLSSVLSGKGSDVRYAHLAILYSGCYYRQYSKR